MSVITVTIDYSLSKSEMIVRGKYGYVNDFLRNNEPSSGCVQGKGTKIFTLELIHFDERISTNEAKQRIKEKCLVSAGVEHLLALGEQFPNLQKQFPIIVLGSVWQSLHSFCDLPYLAFRDGERTLGLSYDYGDYAEWSKGWRFLCVCESR